MARVDARARLLMSAPGVGAIVALTYVGNRRSDAIQFFEGGWRAFGLTPKKHQSGEKDITGKISKLGDGLVRTALYQAAHIILTRPVKGHHLKSWAAELARQAGMKKAKVALARRLAVILHRMWINNTQFTPLAVGSYDR